MNNKLSVKVKYFGGVTNNSVSGNISNLAAIRAVPNLTDLMVNQNNGENGRERNDRVVLYNIQHNFLSEFAAREEEAVAELKQNGVIAFIDAKHETVSIDNAEDVFARLVPDTPDASDNPDMVDAIDSIDSDVENTAGIETVDTVDDEGADSVDNNEEVAAVSPDEELSIENSEATVDEEVDGSEDTAEIEDNEIVEEAYEVAIDNNWDSAVIILTGYVNGRDELNTRLSQLLYYKTLEAGRYDVRLLEEALSTT